MSDLMARLTAIVTVALAVIAAAALWVTSNPGLRGGTEARADFDDAYPLLEGMHVRVHGAVAGSVKQIELGDDGNAHVTMQLFESTEPPRRDATATVRQEDITGDSFLSLQLGHDPRPLGDGVIPTSRTMVAPRFDDLLNSFDEPVRQGLELVLVQVGQALEGRGVDVNRAALRLRPALRAADQALAEVNSQNLALRALIGDAERVTGQAAQRSRELGSLVGSLERTLRTTAGHAVGLDRALEAAPPTVAQATETLARLDRFADAAYPLALTLRRAAPDLARTADLLGPFATDADAILGDVNPTLGLTAGLLRASRPTLRANPRRIFTAPFDVTAGLGGLLDSLLGDEALLRSLFSADAYGGEGPGELGDDVGLGAIAVERGTQGGAYRSDYDPERRLVRSVAIPSCENFGAPIRPGCLAAAVANLLGSVPGLLPLPGGGSLPRAEGHRDSPAGPGSGAVAPAEGAAGTREPATPPQVGAALPDLEPQPAQPAQPESGLIGDLLDFLLGP